MEKVMNEKIIMNYEVVELLHKSSSWGNIVFKVKPQNKEKLYVLKCFPKIENGLQKLIFKREIEALRTLNVCEGIVKLRDSSTELYPFKENECYGGILMDYVPGETLDHINWNKYTQLKKYEICLQILKAVNNAHSNNVIHRDLKPSNIIYDKYADKVTLIDFGTSKIKTVMDSETTMPLYSEGYSAPELILGKNITEKCDYYSIGIIMSEILLSQKNGSDINSRIEEWTGKVTLIQGNPGKGKTWLAMAIAAYCTNGKELPNALPIEPFNVLYQTAEDGIADTIKPRLAKCGADMTRVRFINEDEKQLSMTDDRIEKAIRQNSVRLMIMDPIQAYLGANVDMNRANEIRPLFRHLSTIAERTGCAIVLIGHLNKSSGSQSDYRSLGSIDIAAAVRSILFVEKVEKEKEQDIRVVYQQKDSLAKKENPVAFSLGEEGLKWLGEYDISIEDLLMGKAGTKKETKLEKAQKLILELLTKRKVMCLEELEAELLAYGISSRTGRDARKQLENRLSYDWCQGRKTVALITE